MYNNTNLAIKLEEGIIPEWDYITNEIKNVFRLTDIEFDELRKSKIAKIIAAIPFEAGCYEPERTAIAHLCLFMAEKKGFGKYCSHVPSDDTTLYNRLSFISTFEGGDEKVIEYGMNMLAYFMVEGYHKSESYDKENNIYNPFVSGKWNYKQTKSLIMKKLESYSNELLDVIFTTIGPVGGWT